MAFSDPQTLTISTVANSLARIAFGPNAGVFSKDDGTVKLTVSHTYGKRTRRVVKIDASKISADPFTPAINSKSSFQTYLVIDEPINGFTIAEKKAYIDALCAFLTTSSGASTTKILGGEV